MKRFYKFITGTLALLAINIFLLPSVVNAQLSVSITYSGMPVETLEVCSGSAIVLNSAVTNDVGNIIYTWSCDPPTTFVGIGNFAYFADNTPPGVYDVTLDILDESSLETATANVEVTILARPDANITNISALEFCQGESVELLETNGQSNVNYRWLKNGNTWVTPYTGDNNYFATETGNFQVRVTSAINGCWKNSNTLGVTVNPLPDPNPSSNSPICSGDDLELYSAGGMEEWAWSFNSAVISDQQNYTISGATSANSGTYSIYVKDAKGCENTLTTEALVYEPLDPGVIETNHSICYGGDPDEITSDTDPSGGGDVWTTYEWQSRTTGAWAFIAGANGLTYDPPAGLTVTTHYRRRGVSTACGNTDWSNQVTVTVYAEVLGGTIGSDDNICYNEIPDPFTNDGLPTGGTDTWTYAWEMKVGAGAWTTIVGATNSTYSHLTPLTETTMFRRKATDALCGFAYSNEITISVYDAIDGGEIATDQTICFGGNPDAFTDETPPLGGNGAWTYSWESKVGAGAWALIGGANLVTYDVPAGLTETTMYRRLSTNLCGTGYSNEITVTVYDDLDGGTIGSNHSICYNGDPSNISSSGPASGGDGNFTYLWQSSTNGIDWTDTGVPDLSYDPPAGLQQTTQYRRQATTGCGVVYSNIVTVTVYAEVLGGTIVADQDICYNDVPAELTSSVDPTGGTGAWVYVWQYQPDGSSTWTAITGANGLDYQPLALTVTTKFRRQATNDCGTAYSNEITINVWDAIDGGTISIVDNEVCYNESPGTIQNAGDPSGGTGVTTYAWEQKVGAGAWTPIAGETNNTYDVPALTATTSFRRLATNDCGSDYSNELTITVNPLPTQFNVTGGGSYCEGEAGLAVGLDGSQSNVTYTLYLDGAPTATTLSGTGGVLNFGFQLEGTYTVHAKNNTTSCENMMAGSAVIVEVAAIDDNTISADQLICSGTVPAGLTGSSPIGGTGSYDYQWYSSTNGVNFSPIALATNQNYSPDALTQTTYFRRDVISGVCSSTSNTIEITVNPPISNNTIGTSHTICYDAIPNNLTGSTPSGGNGAYDYQWQTSTAGAAGPYGDIGGATGQNYQPGNLTQDTWFRRVVSSPPCTENISTEIKVTVSPEFTITGFDTVDPECNGYATGEAEVNHTGGIAPYFYSWSPSGQSTKRATGLVADTEYTVTVNDSQGCPASGVNTVTLSQPTAIAVDPADITLTNVLGCYGDATGSIEVVASGGTPDYVYTLYDDATLIDTQTPVHPATAVFGGLAASNNYRISVTDVNNCPAAEQTNIVLTQPDELIIDDVATTEITCNGYNDGTIIITAHGGTPPYEYSIDGPTGIGTFGSDNEFIVGEGGYDIYVRDSHGCEVGWPVQVQLINPPAISFSYSVDPITTCYGAPEGEITIFNVSGGSGSGYMYSIYDPAVWEPDPVFENLPGGPANEYYISVMDSEGCVEIANGGLPVTINQPTEITFNVVNIVNVTGCWYNTNGSFRVNNVTGGTGLKEVSIDGGLTWKSTPSNFPFLGVNTYTVTVRDENGCMVSQTVDITGPDPIVISSLNLTHNLCFGDANGIIDATATPGTGTLNYSLLLEGVLYAGSQATGLFENLVAGDYTLEIRDDNSCLLSQDITITSPDELIVETDITNISCSFAGNEGVISARATGGTEPYTITLYLGAVEQANFTGVLEGDWVDFTGLADASNYEVIVRDFNHPTCNEATSGLLTVVVPDELLIDPLSIITEDLTCNGLSTGTITIAGLGGTLPYTYTLFDDLSNQVGDAIVANNTDPVQFIDLAAGTYTVEIDDANSCGPVNSAPITLIEPDAIEIDPLSLVITNISCFGANDGEISLTATGGIGDLYYTITQGGVPVVGFATQTNNGTFAPLEPGTYVIEITDDNGCGPTLSDELTVVEPEALDINTIISDALCNGDNGSFDALASNGTAPYTYNLEDALSNPVETQNGDVDEWRTFSNLTPGDYTLYVSDFNGCSNSTLVTINEPAIVGVSITFFDHPTCDSEGNSTPGVITAEATGGIGTYVYSIYRNGIYQSENATGIFDALSSGDYYVEVYDSNGCGPATTATQTLDSPTDIVIDVINITDILCNGELTGKLEIIVINANGTPLYTITEGDDDWQTDNTFTGLAAGDYTVRVKDDNNCIISQLVTITEPLLLEFTTVLTPPTSAVDIDGSIQVNVTGGTPNYWYELNIWNDVTITWDFVDKLDNTSATTHTFTGLGVGFYRIIVTDANGCSTFFDTPLSQFNITLTATDALCFESCDGTITITPVGGTIQSVTWEKDGVDFTTEMEANYDIDNDIYNNLCAGVYVAVVTDTESNVATASIEIQEPTAIEVDYIVDIPDCFTNLPVASITFDITGGTPFTDGYDITWDGGSVRGFVVEDLGPGTYNFVISDQNGCEFAVEEIEIVYPEGMTLTSLFVYDLLCHENNSGEISMLVGGGTEPITYQIDGPSGLLNNNDGIFTGLEAGDYELAITDANGCPHIFEESNTVQIAQPTAIVINQISSTIDPLNCHYDILDILGMEVTGGTPDYTYSWDNGQETIHLFDVSPGDYTLTVTDANGCESAETVNVPGPEPLQLTFTVDIAKCRLAPEGNTGQINITNLTGGTGVFSNDFNLEWYLEGMGDIDRDNFWTIDQLQAGTYYAVITDQNSCEDIIYFEVPYNEDNAFTVGIDMEDNYCFRDNAVLTAIPIQGSFGSPAEFEWYNVTSNPDVIVGTSSNYNTPELTQNTRMLVRVISSMGCLEQRERTINVYPEIGPFLDRDDHSFFSDADTIAFRIDLGEGNSIGDTAVISILADTEYPVEVLTKNADYTLSYAWNPSDFFSPSNEKNSTMIFRSGTYEPYFTGQLFNTITQKNEQYIPLLGQVRSEFGCVETINLKARILDRIKTSNVFSPNGDGINDIWTIPYSDLFPDLEIKVFNRWGAVVWSAKGSEASRGWKGTNKNGKDLPVGTYYYVISFNVEGTSKWKPVSGSVTIIR